MNFLKAFAANLAANPKTTVAGGAALLSLLFPSKAQIITAVSVAALGAMTADGKGGN